MDGNILENAQFTESEYQVYKTKLFNEIPEIKKPSPIQLLLLHTEWKDIDQFCVISWNFYL